MQFPTPSSTPRIDLTMQKASMCWARHIESLASFRGRRRFFNAPLSSIPGAMMHTTIWASHLSVWDRRKKLFTNFKKPKNSSLTPLKPPTNSLLLAKQKNPQAAREKFQAFQQMKVEKDKKEKAGLLNDQGNADLKAGKYREAARAYAQAVALDPTNAQWHYNYSLALSELGDRVGVKRELVKAVQLDPNLARAHNDLGLSYLSDGKLQKAEKEFKTALDIDPQFAEAQNNLGVLYTREGKGSEAINLFRQATQNNPQYAQAFMNWGIVLASQGHYYRASALF